MVEASSENQKHEEQTKRSVSFTQHERLAFHPSLDLIGFSPVIGCLIWEFDWHSVPLSRSKQSPQKGAKIERES